MAEYSDPHHVVAIIETATDHILQYRVCPVDPDDSTRLSTQYDPATQHVKRVDTVSNSNAGFRVIKDLVTWSPTKELADPHKFTSYDKRLPDNPRLRAAAYRSMPDDMQEAVVYSILCSTGLPLKRVAAWLCVKAEEVSAVVSEEVAAAARAELDLRIAKKMVAFAMLNKSPAAMSACLFLTKVFLKWNENGMGEESTAPDSKLVQSLFDKLEVVETHRDANGVTLQEPTRLQLVQKG